MTKRQDWEVALDQAPEPCLRELLRQSEMFLSGTVTLGIAADQRASTLCTVFSGGGIAFLVGAAAVLTGSSPSFPLECALSGTATILFIGSWLAAKAAAPVNFHPAGYEPKNLARSSADEQWMIRYTIIDIQQRIEVNRTAIDREARLTSWAIRTAALAIATGILTFSVLSWTTSPSSKGRLVEGVAAAGAAERAQSPYDSLMNFQLTLP
jgi:hypothetical protein